MFKEEFIRLCTEKGVSPTAVCLEIGLSNSAYTQWTEKSKPRKTTLLKITNYFKLPKDHFDNLDREEKTNTRFQHSLGVMSIAKEMTERQGDLSGGVYHGGKEPTILKNKNKNPEIQQIIHKLTTVEIPDDVIEFINNALDAYKK